MDATATGALQLFHLRPGQVPVGPVFVSFGAGFVLAEAVWGIAASPVRGQPGPHGSYEKPGVGGRPSREHVEQQTG